MSLFTLFIDIRVLMGYVVCLKIQAKKGALDGS
jgi:hypothetical protein